MCAETRAKSSRQHVDGSPPPQFALGGH
ncbi:hypothetical protein SUNI508_05273 [Seiridium unicorne]|uniref:Uncharacterized protein n=1 Tax=Seiridium unicorne TaxID=138068 RepID=A0ABR2V4Y2_9PEZI